MQKTIRTALVSVYHKEGLRDLADDFKRLGINLISTGGTKDYLESLGCDVTPVEDLTAFPAILGGRVKTLNHKIFGGILMRRDNRTDRAETDQYGISAIDLVIVDLYPFEKTVTDGASHEDIIEKIDIGGISLIRAAAKNYRDVVVIPSADQYDRLHGILQAQNGDTTIEQRAELAAEAFQVSSHYDTAIYDYVAGADRTAYKAGYSRKTELRYGENPHQGASFYGEMQDVFDQLNGKALSYNNLVDVDAALNILNDFENETTFIAIKHTNPCGLASADTVYDAWRKAHDGDPVSIFGGVLACNRTVDLKTAEEINGMFYEILMAPDFEPEALELLKKKSKRIILRLKNTTFATEVAKSILNGVLRQDRDTAVESTDKLSVATEQQPTDAQTAELLFANKIVKHCKSNAIVLTKDKQLIGLGVGQTSRVDATEQAVAKAKRFEFETEGAVLASDAFFPMPDSLEIAAGVGVKTVIQPGGSIKDQASIDFCNANGMTMVMTGIRHFKH